MLNKHNGFQKVKDAKRTQWLSERKKCLECIRSWGAKVLKGHGDCWRNSVFAYQGDANSDDCQEKKNSLEEEKTIAR